MTVAEGVYVTVERVVEVTLADLERRIDRFLVTSVDGRVAVSGGQGRWDVVLSWGPTQSSLACASGRSMSGALDQTLEEVGL